jgi:pimeloyl-ACP methyl ester carboxylesterase
LNVPVTFIYGDKDWMLSIDQEAPARCIQALNNTKAAAHPPKPDSPDRKIFTIPDAGHYLFIDQPVTLLYSCHQPNSHAIVNACVRPTVSVVYCTIL